MQLSQIFSLAALASVVSAITVSYDPGYDNRDRSLTAVSCSDGPNGLMTRKSWRKQGDIPVFPFIGGAQVIAGWGSPNCGTCWKLEFQGQSINVLAIDHTDAGFNIAQAAMDKLTNNQAVQLGRIDAKATQIDSKKCGM
ncbi:cerato-platanin domain-containing protein [Hirsutella rhossiliensis]|uniref:Cerato-platanin domain-containing protein n=1 Tax=Hirsutella rhossiliensis TaxID=111463 RepID=A0A9P8MSG2_9HYPO|nr:cerato-platanin domain-containing protein [Hirsutella rhossiliensis]KAH0959624.1 cerato-platanin domain-containing protein [Hirsutella rhossiliensis]